MEKRKNNIQTDYKSTSIKEMTRILKKYLIICIVIMSIRIPIAFIRYLLGRADGKKVVQDTIMLGSLTIFISVIQYLEKKKKMICL